MARILYYSVLLGKIAAVGCWLIEPWSIIGPLCFFVPDLCLLYHLLAPSSQWLCRVFTWFETDENEVWLTIDDGPDGDDTPRILDLLDQHGARATFFVIGQHVARWPNLIGQILSRGHEIGHHTHTHPLATFWCASRRRLRRELDDALAVLRSRSARPVRFRPPVGIKNIFLATELKTRGMHCVGWTIRSGDCLGREAEEVVADVMKRVKPGAILLLHEGRSVPKHMRVRVVALLLQALTVQGYRCVVPRLDQLRSSPPAKTVAVRRSVTARPADPVSVAD